MRSQSLTIEQVLTLLTETPPRIAALTADLAPAQLHTPPNYDEWSLNDLLAHLRACADVMRNEIAASGCCFRKTTWLRNNLVIPFRPVTPLCHTQSIGTPVPGGVGITFLGTVGTLFPSQRDSSSAMLEANSGHGKQSTMPQSQRNTY